MSNQSIYDNPDHELLRDQVAKFIAREVEPHAAPGKSRASCRATCCAAWARPACSA